MPGGPGDAPARFLACGEKAHPPPAAGPEWPFLRWDNSILCPKACIVGKMGNMLCGEGCRTVKNLGFKPKFNFFRHDNFPDFSGKPLAIGAILW